MNREEVERDRLRERKGGFSSYHEPGGLSVPDAKDSAMYAADSDRFHTDYAAEAKGVRDMAQAKKAAEIERRRDFFQGMQEKRDAEEMAASLRWEQETAALQADGRPALKNMSGAPVDLLTQQYRADESGALLRQADERVLSRAAQRAQYLAEQSTGVNFNIVSGAAAPVGRPVQQLAQSLGVPAPAPYGLTHRTFVNASVTGPHVKVREEARSRPILRTLR
jgi:hypothetical protein